MSHQPDPSHHVRRVILPSGRAIEVVYFDNQPAHAPHPAPSSPNEAVDLHICPDCAKRLYGDIFEE